MKCKITENQISWHVGGRAIFISLEHIDQAVFSSDQKVIIALAGANASSKKIIVYELDGQIRCEIEQPKDHSFNCLGPNRGNDVAVLSTIYHIGWRDWWFAIDAKAGTVESLGEGR